MKWLTPKFTTNLPYCKVNFSAKGYENHLSDVELRIISNSGFISEAILPGAQTLVELLRTGAPEEYSFELKTTTKIKNLPPPEITFVPTASYSLRLSSDYRNRVLIITPSYPSDNIPYLAPFIHAKVKKYQQHGIKADIAVVNYEKKLYRYHYDGVDVQKVSYTDLLSLLSDKRHRTILVHFFDPNLAHTLLAADLSNKQVLLYSHGAEVDLYNKDIYGQYFSKNIHFTKEQLSEKAVRAQLLKSLTALPQVRWIFNTRWNYQNAKKVTGLSFPRHHITPCVVDGELFNYINRPESRRLNILILKKMDNLRSYAVDIAVDIILKLSKKPYFNDLNITVVGAGNYQSELVAPLKHFSNVTIINKLYSPPEVAKYFQKSGILLAPSRYDTQGLTVDEAAMSGMVVVASKGTGVSDMLPESLGTFFDNNRPGDAVKIIESIVKDPAKFQKLSEAFHAAISKSASEEAITSDFQYLTTTPPRSASNAGAFSGGKTLALLEVAFFYRKQKRSYPPLSEVDFRHSLDTNFYDCLKTIKFLAPQVFSGPDLEDFAAQLQEIIFQGYLSALEQAQSYRKFKKLDNIIKPFPEFYSLPAITKDYPLPAYIQLTRKYGLPYHLLRKIKRTLSFLYKT